MYYVVFWKNVEYFFSSWSNSKFRIAFWIEFKSRVGEEDDGGSLFSCMTMVCCLFFGDTLKGKMCAKWHSWPALQLPWLKNRQDAGNRFVVVYMTKSAWAERNQRPDAFHKLVLQDYWKIFSSSVNLQLRYDCKDPGTYLLCNRVTKRLFVLGFLLLW